MTPPSCWPDRGNPVILDASAIINLNGSGLALEILTAVDHKFLVAEDVVQEIALGIETGRPDAKLLTNLIEAGAIQPVTLGTAGLELFEQITIGESFQTLDDGEAATIALAAELNAAAVIDEKKGRRICFERAPAVSLIGSVEIFLHPDVQQALGNRLANVVFSALSVARMQVLPEHQAWVVELLGVDRAGLCRSLPRSRRA